MYSALWCKSNFSFLEGASHPEELVEKAHDLGIPHLALTDRDGVYGVVRAHVRARELGVHLIIGSEVTVADAERGTDSTSTLVLLAADRDGYANLCRLLTAGRRRHPKGRCTVEWGEVQERAPGLLALWGGERSLLVREQLPADVIPAMQEAFGDRLYALAARHRRAEEVLLETRLRERAKHAGIPLLAATEVLYHTPARRDLQDVLTCIRHGVTLGGAGRLTKPNAEHGLDAPHAFAGRFADDPTAVARTLEVSQRCTFSLSEIRYR